MNVQEYLDKGITVVVEHAPTVLMAVVVLVIGLWIMSAITRGFGRSLKKSNLDVSLQGFLVSLTGVILKILLIFSVVEMVGINVISFVAIFTAASLAVGMALQGSLSNFAGGVMILLFKPFKVDDVIEAAGYIGKVSEIQIFNTILKTPDNKTIIIPNSVLSGTSLVNYSTEATRRVDFTFGIGYGDDIKKAKEVLNRIVKEDSRIFDDPAPAILVAELADSSVNFAVRVWAKAEDYWDIYFEMHEKVKLEFDKEGISIPFPQQDVHVFNN